MPTFGDILAGANYASLPQIAAEHVQLLWYVEFWDGPRAGVLRYRDERCWFQVVAENEADEGWYRRFVVVRLTPAQLADEQRWDALFREKVRHHPHLQPRERWNEFYEPYALRTPRNLSGNEVLGWFER